MQKLCSFELKAVGESGAFEGYAAVYGNVDQGGDMIQPGAFGKTIADRGGKNRDVVFLQCRHGRQVAELQLGHAAALLSLKQRGGDAVVLEHLGHVFTGAGFVSVHVAGGK